MLHHDIILFPFDVKYKLEYDGIARELKAENEGPQIPEEYLILWVFGRVIETESCIQAQWQKRTTHIDNSATVPALLFRFLTCKFL